MVDFQKYRPTGLSFYAHKRLRASLSIEENNSNVPFMDLPHLQLMTFNIIQTAQLKF
jgi:hypothetical protein